MVTEETILPGIQTQRSHKGVFPGRQFVRLSMFIIKANNGAFVIPKVLGHPPLLVLEYNYNILINKI